MYQFFISFCVWCLRVVCTWVYGSVCPCAHKWSLSRTITPPSYDLRQSWTEACLGDANWTTSSWIGLTPSASAGFKAHTLPSILCGCWRFELRSLRLQDKCSISVNHVFRLSLFLSMAWMPYILYLSIYQLVVIWAVSTLKLLGITLQGTVV